MNSIKRTESEQALQSARLGLMLDTVIRHAPERAFYAQAVGATLDVSKILTGR